ncbi:TonB-dependent receptor [Niabella insulamsoli]|uniref:TonB-dependent receptor n=1 Tax=Niabella insulamsoli TaxID=3144874 RepID=UPI0031FDE7D6
MKKSASELGRGPINTLRKMLLVMKLSMLIVLLCVFQAQAKESGAQNISLVLKNTEIKHVLKAIEENSRYRFLYNYDLQSLDQRVDFRAENSSLSLALEHLLAGTGLQYKMLRKNLVAIVSTGSDAPILSVRGKVVNDTGEPLAGVSVVEKGTANGTATDQAGNFSINVADGNAVLVFSYTGYVTQEVAVSSTNEMINVSLKKNENALDEVVIVGYGSQKKSDLIGSVAQVDAEQINNRSVPQLSQALTGQLPGVTIIQRSGQPGNSGGNIRVRGVGSFGSDPSALILVDGIPANSLDEINPNDVEAVSVLKDASSAAIYGARAANGVILVTTKSGSGNGKLNINYNGYIGIQKATEYPEQVPSWEFATLMNEAQPNTYTAEEIQKFRDGSDPDNYADVNYVDRLFKKSFSQTAHNLSIANKTEKTQYQLSFGYLYQNGLVEKNNYNRYNVRLNMVNNIARNIKLTTRIAGMQFIDNQPAPPATLDFGDMVTLIGQIVRYPSFFPAELSNGDWGQGNNNAGTPVSFLASESFFKNKGQELLLNVRADWDIIKDLKFSMIGGYTYAGNMSQRFLANQRLNETVTVGPGTLTQINRANYYKTFQQLLEYTKKLGDHEVSLLAGHSFEENRNESSEAYRGGFVNNQLTQLNAGDAATQTNEGTANEWALDSYFGRLRYSYKSKYLVEGVLRHDGSSRFPPAYKYATFPGVALGWRLSNERFFKEAIPWINDLKLKASYGTLGNQNIGNYPYQSVFAPNFNYPIGSGLQSGSAVTTIVDNTIRWESTRTKDIGIDVTTLNRKLSLSATYFDRYTYDILVSPGGSVSNVLGFTVGVQNSGSLSNTGWEFTASYRNNIKDFNYRAEANFSIINNKVLSLGVGNVDQPNGLVGNGNDLFIGYATGAYYGLVADGLFVDQADIDSYVTQTPSVNPGARPGDIRYKDISGPDGVPDGQVDLTYDRTIIGSTIPRYNYGLNLGGNYKGFDFSVLLQGVAKVQGRLLNYAGYAFYQSGTIQRYQADGRWTEANPDRNATYPRLEIISNSGTANSRLSSFWMLDASYMRLKTVQLGYNIPKNIVAKIRLDGVRVFASGENLLTFNKYPQGWDPEINSGGAYYPILKNYTFGLNVNF